MQNMIQLQKRGKLFNVFFDMNRETEDFDNILVRTSSGETLQLSPEDLEKIKDLITEEVVASTMELALAFKSGTMVAC